MRLRPKSLAGQMLLLVAAALFIAQAINFALLLSEVRARRANFTEGGAIARTVDAVERVQSNLPVERVRGRGPDRLMVTVGPPDVGAGDQDEGLEVRLVQALAQAGIVSRGVRATRESDRRGPAELVVSVELADGRWVNLRSILPPGDLRLVMPVLGQTLILLLALLVAVILIGRHVARPLRRLDKATETFGTSGRQEPVPLEGPGDVKRLIATFNRMQTRIFDMLDEKDRMLGAIGHDLRTPLASLRLRAESVENEGERERMIDTINEMARTLEEILSLARLGRSSESPVRVDLTALLDALAQDLQDLGQPVTFKSGQRMLAHLRPVLMRRAIRNLIENAVKYGSRAEVRLQPDGSQAVIEIEDVGPGIPPEEADRVMEGFVRLDASRSRETGGSGLGLTIARSIIHEHGGSLQLENRPEGGLRATVRLPLERRAELSRDILRQTGRLATHPRDRRAAFRLR